jgi:hypothetical protein
VRIVDAVLSAILGQVVQQVADVVHATIMGVLAMSYLFGDACARFYLGFFMRQGMGWRGIFFIAAGTLSAIAFVSFGLPNGMVIENQSRS